MLTSVQELHFNPTPMKRCLLKSGKDVDQSTRASLQPNTYEEVSTASMSHTGENDFWNSTPTKGVQNKLTWKHHKWSTVNEC